MKKLSEHNADRHMIHSTFNDKKQNAGVKCDDCDVEMYYKDLNTALLSMPPSQWVFCPNCNKRDLKVM